MRIVASLTTIPSRIRKIEPVIKALYNQKSLKFDNIYLNIPLSFKGKKYILPEFLNKYDNLKILRCDIDYGPITKLIPVLEVELDPNTIIITFDDDSIPSKNVLKIFINKVKKYPNTSLSFSGWCIGKFPFYLEFIGDNIKDVEVDWIQGTHGILYHRRFINKEELLDYPKPDNKNFLKNDDHWISYYLEKNKIKRISIGQSYKENFRSSEICKVDAISGNYSLKFFKEVLNISFYLKNIGIYYRSVSVFNSIFFKIFLSVILVIIICVYIIKNIKK